jgi:integrase
MALTDTFTKQVKHTGKPAVEKHADGDGMYLLVKAAGKYWRMDYSFGDKRKTLALGIYPEVSLSKARQRRVAARELLAGGTDPSEARRAEKLVSAVAAANTFKAVALEWHSKKEKSSAANTSAKRLTQLENHIFPAIGSRPIDAIKPPEILAMLRKVEAAGTAYTAGRLREICGQVCRYAIQTGKAEYDPAAAMRGAIEKHSVNHRPALTTRREFGEFVRDLRDTTRADPLTKLCARFGLLTWTRPKELRQARWEHIDMEACEWRIPAIEMKTGKHLQAHTVALSPEAMAVLPALRELSGQ